LEIPRSSLSVFAEPTPKKEIDFNLRKEKWTFPADIEVEYQIPPGSSPVAEVASSSGKEALA
jgi:hypothetical protein